MNNITQERFEELKRDVDKANKAAERAKGALDETIKTLKEEFGCTSLKQAKDKLAALELKSLAAKQEFERALKDYEQKWQEEG